MSAKHTPGPWHWDSDPVKGDPMGRVRYQVCALGKTITKVYHSSYEGGLTNAEADARLIAAAPDLLVALKRLVGTPSDPNNGWRGDAKTSNEHFRCEYCGVEDLDCVALPHTDQCPISAARAAIARATGENHG